MSDSEDLNTAQLAAYFALTEASSLLQHAVEQQLRTEGGLSWVQFQILARLNDATDGQLRMTDIADAVVYSRSALTYQAEKLDDAGLVTRSPSSQDERSIIVTITKSGRALVARVLPGHIEVVHRMLIAPLSARDIATLTRLMARVRDGMRTAPPRSASPRKASQRNTDTKIE